MKILLPIFGFLLVLTRGYAADEPKFASELFKAGTLVYSDHFDGELNRERWGAPKGKKIENRKLIVDPQFTSKEEAMKVLKRDHHLVGLREDVS